MTPLNKPFRPEETVEGPLQMEAIITRMMGRNYTATIVRVDEVQAGGAGPVGFLTATDLLQQVNGNNEGIPNAPMVNMPYFRLQGGVNAIVIDPKPGDIGIAIFARRDISEAKRNKTQGPPPSLRQFDQSDGLYIGGLLNGAPSQFIHFLESGIRLKSTGPFTVDASLVQVNCDIMATGDITDNSGDQAQSMSSMRAVYNSHTHPGGDPTGTPNQEM